ncbi:MAG: hypothetical protein MJ056_08350 [Akkermansia sp.]|nr:hypothetical protein [Akkermansia sp.]
MEGKATLALRILLSLLGAAALLYVFSYPDSIIPRSLLEEELEDERFTRYALKPLMFIVPLLFMEMVSLCGSRRNLVWFSGLIGVLLAAVAAWPVLTARMPELVHPTFGFEDGKLAHGMLCYAAVVACSLLVRVTLLSYLFKYYRSPDDEASYGDVDAAELDPEHALTVREIAARPAKAKPRFLFLEIDVERIRSFHELMASLLGRRRRTRRAIIAGLALLAAWVAFFPQPNPKQALLRDLDAMYATRGTASNGMQLATTRAVHAAYRVMEYVSAHESFAGFTREKAEKWLRLDRAPEAYRRQLRDERDLTLPSVDDTFESRTRFLTVTDGTRWAVLFIRTNEAGDIINIAEVQDAGWNAIADELRRQYGEDWRGAYFRD